MQKSREGHGENWTHLVYKLDNLFRSIRVSDENSSVTRALQCIFKLIWTQAYFCIQYASFKATTSITNTFWHHLLFFTHLPICLERQMTVQLKITTKWSLKMLKIGMLSSFHPHSMCERVQRVTAKTGCASCTKRTISFEVSGFHTVTKGFHFLELIWTP